MSLLLLDRFLEGADGFCPGDFNRKDALRVIAEHNTVEVENGSNWWQMSY